jgi:hypothetical protein
VAAALIDPFLYRLLIFHVPKKCPLSCCVVPPLETLPSPDIRFGEYFTFGLFCLQRKHLALWLFPNNVFHGEALLAPRKSPKLDDHTSSAVRDCLFNIYTDTQYIADRFSFRNLRTRRDVVTGTHLSRQAASFPWIIHSTHTTKFNTKRSLFRYIPSNPTCTMSTSSPH